MVFEYTDADGYTMSIARLLVNGKPLTNAVQVAMFLLNKSTPITLDVHVRNPKGEAIKIRDVEVSISKFLTLLEVFKKADSARTVGDFIEPLFGEARAMMDLVRG